MSKRVEIILGKDGTINVEAHDFQGDSCEKATEFLDEMFGDATTSTKKMEYYLGEKETDLIGSGHCG